MSSSWTLRAAWGDRPEPVASCARRLVAWLDGMAGADPALAEWFLKGRTRASADRPVPRDDPDAVEALLLGGRNRRDSGGEVIEELGFSIGLWNRQPVAVGLRATVGGSAAAKGVRNSLALTLPPVSAESASLHQRATAERVMAALVEAWDPQWASWYTLPLLDAQAPGPHEPVVGWLTHLSEPCPPGPLPGGATCRPWAGGSLLALADRAQDVTDGAVVAVRRHLVDHGAIRPTG